MWQSFRSTRATHARKDHKHDDCSGTKYANIAHSARDTAVLIWTTEMSANDAATELNRDCMLRANRSFSLLMLLLLLWQLLSLLFCSSVANNEIRRSEMLFASAPRAL